MSSNPETPQHLHPLAPGYNTRQLELDAAMGKLGRPHLSTADLLRPAAVAAHRAACEAWEHDNPDAAAEWLNLRSQAITEDRRLYDARYGPEAACREQMRVAGFPEGLTARAMSKHGLHASATFTATRDWAADGTRWSLTLIGPPGCGKTQAATWAAFQLFTRNRFAPRFVQCLKRCDAPLFGMEAEEYRWRCAEAGVLVLDDMGEGEQRNEKRSAWRGWLDDVLTQRHTAKRKTIITTNRSPAQISEWLGARIADRLVNDGVMVGTNEPSLRGQREPGEDT